MPELQSADPDQSQAPISLQGDAARPPADGNAHRFKVTLNLRSHPSCQPFDSIEITVSQIHSSKKQAVQTRHCAVSLSGYLLRIGGSGVHVSGLNFLSGLCSERSKYPAK
jgi:hypothetical protein